MILADCPQIMLSNRRSVSTCPVPDDDMQVENSDVKASCITFRRLDPMRREFSTICRRIDCFDLQDIYGRYVDREPSRSNQSFSVGSVDS